MNKRRRRIAKARRHQIRVVREMNAWITCGWMQLPRGGRLWQPAENIKYMLWAGQHQTCLGLERVMDQVRVFMSGRPGET